MIKDTFSFLVFFLVLGLIHFFLLPFLPEIKYTNDFYIIYILLFTISVMGNTLFYFNVKLKMMNFAGMFIVFTTIQLLAAMSYSLAMKLIREEHAKVILIHFVVAFFVTILFQSIYLIKKQQREPQ